MRVFKFRAWNPETKKMFYDFDQNIKEVALGKSIHLFVYETGLAHKTLMQYTSLKDKNGKEVFEGDIMPYHFNEKVKGIVKFGFYINPCDDKHSSHIGFYLEFTNERERELYRKDLGYWIKTTYVEGNIHENPELLNQ